MKGICAPAEQGNARDGVWLEHKEVLRLYARDSVCERREFRARWKGFMWGFWIASALAVFFASAAASAEEPEELENERCYAPYAPELVKEFEVDNIVVTVHWYDSVEEMTSEMGDIFGTRDWSAASDCEKKPEFNISYCDIYVERPTSVDDNATMSIGHEVLHGLFGAYHD